ncbi:MAG: S-layer homology domain-containing protein [Synergistes sp.]|nr:S-layer homology domain-containing protein [Synergistes sp.]
MKKFIAVIAMIAVAAFAAPVFAATNPFMDVPQGHWAYDAVGLLASRGIVSGYPDGSFKGPQPATRYEVASIVARALVAIDADKASKQDLELLKKLVMEFKDELDALGVKVDKLDKRVAVLEDGVGGWKIRGTFLFEAKFSSDTDSGNYNFTENGLKNDFEKEQFRLYLTKQISENTYFFGEYRTGADGSDAPIGRGGRGDLQNMSWAQLFIDTKLPYDIGFRAGRFTVDFEDEYGLYTDNDALFGDFRIDGFQLQKQWDTFRATAIVGRNDNYGFYDPTAETYGIDIDSSYMAYILDLNWQPNEKFFAGLTGYWFNEDALGIDGIDLDARTYAAYLGYRFTPAAELKGIYYWQKFGDDVVTLQGIPAAAAEDSPNAWKAILNIDQDLLKFTSLWIEYSQQDNTFFGYCDRYSIGGGAYDFAGLNMDVADPFGTSKYWFVKAEQQWNDKWSTFLRFAHVDYDTANLDDATEWGAGIAYQYTPALRFELAYDHVDHGDSITANNGGEVGKDHIVRFSTTVNF